MLNFHLKWQIVVSKYVSESEKLNTIKGYLVR